MLSLNDRIHILAIPLIDYMFPELNIYINFMLIRCHLLSNLHKSIYLVYFKNAFLSLNNNLFLFFWLSLNNIPLSKNCNE